MNAFCPARVLSVLVVASGSLWLAPAARAVPLTPDTAQAPGAQNPVREKLVQAARAIEAGDYKTAQARLDEVAKADADNAEMLLVRTELFLRQGRRTDAEKALARAVEVHPRNLAVLMAMARFQLAQGAAGRAEEFMKRALIVDGKSPPVHIELGQLLLGSKRDAPGAEREARAALQGNPFSVDAYRLLGQSLLAQRRAEEAVQAFQKAGEVAPGDPRPWQDAGLAELSRKRPDAALAHFDHALKVSPSYAPAMLNKAMVLEAKGDLAGAQAARERAVAVAPGFTTALVELAQGYQRARRPAEADATYAKVLEREPNNLVALNNRAWLAAERGERLDEALGWARKAISLAPLRAEFYDTLGYVYLARKEPKNAIEPLRRAAEASGSAKPVPTYVYRLGVAYAEAGQPTQAIEQLERALAAGSDFPEARDARERLARLKGKS